MNTLNNTIETKEINLLENNLIGVLNTSERVLTAVASTIKGTSFAYLNNYYSKSSGNVNNYLILLGFSLENALMKDFETIKSKKDEVFENFKEAYTNELITLCYNELLTSLEKRTSSEEMKAKLLAENDSTMNRSQGQSEAFTTLAKGVTLHNDTKQVYIFGLELNKTFVEKREEVKETKSSDKTILKNKIKKFLDLKEGKIRRFNFEESLISLQGLKIQG